MKIRSVIVDDEPSSQKVLESYIKKIPSLELVKILDNGLEAQVFLANNSIDLMFLDINMPSISGLELLASLTTKPKVIFTTAYAKYAVNGFNLDAVDYLLKPFSFDRFFKAVSKVKPQRLHSDSIFIKENKKLLKVFFKDINYVEGLGDYVKVCVNDSIITTYSTLKNMHLSLPSNHFIQIHKSFIINFTKINYIQGNFVVLEEYRIPIGPKFKKDLFDKLNA